MEKNNRRIVWIDNAKLICIMFVLLSHMKYLPEYMKIFFEPIFITTFFFLSGYNIKPSKDTWGFVKNRIRTILVPAIIFSLIYLVDFAAVVHRTYSISALGKDMSVLFRQQRGEGDVLWFLYVSFIAEIIIFILLKYFPKIITYIVSTVLMIGSFIYVKYLMIDIPYWYVHVVFVAMFIMLLGYVYRCNQEKVDFIFNMKWQITMVIFYFVTINIGYFGFDSYININDYGAIFPIWIVAVLSGIILIISVSKKLPEKKVMSYIGGNTIIFYLLHDRVRNVLEKVLQIAGVLERINNNILTNTIGSLIMLIAETMILLILAYVINNFFPLLIGRKMRKI